MRKIALSFVTLTMLLPSTAMACHQAQVSSVTVNCEQGVRVYRVTPLAAPAPSGIFILHLWGPSAQLHLWVVAVGLKTAAAQAFAYIIIAGYAVSDKRGNWGLGAG